MRKLGCGLSLPLLLGLGIVFIALLVIGLVSGALGSSFLGRGAPFITQPHPELPTEKIFSIFGFPISNTVLASWITVVVLGLFFFLATRRPRLVPRGLQNLMELPVEMLFNFVKGVAGEKNGRRFFPVVATIFLFVMSNAWLSLIPGYGSIKLLVAEHGEEKLVHLLRGANTDINLPLALALMSFVFVEYWGASTTGFIKYSAQFVNVRNLLKGRILTGFIDIFVGILEALSHFVRVISFTFRLFGNMTAGEILLLIAFFLVPFIMVIPFYFLEILVGFVQALIFGGLTLVFAVVAVAGHGEGETKEHSEGGAQ